MLVERTLNDLRGPVTDCDALVRPLLQLPAAAWSRAARDHQDASARLMLDCVMSAGCS